MIASLAAMAVAAVVVATPPPLASLRMDLEHFVMQATVIDGDAGATLTIECVKGCARPATLTDQAGDTPLGLFMPFDAVPVLMSTWSSGSAYRIRAYRLTSDGIVRVLDASSLAAPSVVVTREGRLEVLATERPTDGATRTAARSVTWVWQTDRFTKKTRR